MTIVTETTTPGGNGTQHLPKREEKKEGYQPIRDKSFKEKQEAFYISWRDDLIRWMREKARKEPMYAFLAYQIGIPIVQVVWQLPKLLVGTLAYLFFIGIAYGFENSLADIFTRAVDIALSTISFGYITSDFRLESLGFLPILPIDGRVALIRSLIFILGTLFIVAVQMQDGDAYPYKNIFGRRTELYWNRTVLVTLLGPLWIAFGWIVIGIGQTTNVSILLTIVSAVAFLAAFFFRKFMSFADEFLIKLVNIMMLMLLGPALLLDDSTRVTEVLNAWGADLQSFFDMWAFFQ